MPDISVSCRSSTLRDESWGLGYLDINYSGDIYRKEAKIKDHAGKPHDAVRARASLPSLSVEIHGADIPAALLHSAEAGVDTPFECLAYIRAFRPELVPLLRHAVVRRGESLLVILSFYENGSRLVVVNRLIRLPDSALAECVQSILEQNPGFSVLEINDLYNGSARCHHDALGSLTWVTGDCAEAGMPGSYEAYLQHFGSTTRKNLRYCARRLERESPHIAFRILQREEITEEIVAAVIGLNHLRMAFKGKHSGMDVTYSHCLAALSQSHGTACVVSDGTKIIAGALCTRVGRGWTLHVIAHDPNYNHVRLGLLCLLRVIAEAIRGGALRFNFLWGASDYKRLFGGEIGVLRARRYYRSARSRWLALHDIRHCLVQFVRRHLSLLHARVRSARK